MAISRTQIISPSPEKDKVTKAFEIITRSHRQKWRSLEMAKRVQDAGYTSRAQRMHDCGAWLKISWTDEAAPAITDARYCRDRLCPTCAWRRSRRQYGDMVDALTRIRQDRPTLRAYMLTLTVRNCTPDDLRATLDRLANGWAKMQKRRPWKRSIIGWARNTEISYNGEAGTFHPHIHALLLQDAGSEALPWAAGGSLEYETNIKTLRSWWLDAINGWDEYANGVIQVDCRAAYAAPGDEDPEAPALAAALEATKYVVKESSAAQMPIKTLRSFMASIFNRRLCAYGGIVKQYAKRDPESDLEDTDPEAEEIFADDSQLIHSIILQWSYSGSAYYVWEYDPSDTASQTLAKALEGEGAA